MLNQTILRLTSDEINDENRMEYVDDSPINVNEDPKQEKMINVTYFYLNFSEFKCIFYKRGQEKIFDISSKS